MSTDAMNHELRDILRDLVQGAGARSAAIVPTAPGKPIGTCDVQGAELRRVPLGNGALLEARFPGETPDDGRAAAVERAARLLRACARRWDADALPSLSYAPSGGGVDRNQIVDRIQTFLRAFSAAQGLINALVMVKRDVIATAWALDEHQQARIPFLRKQLDAEVTARRGETSHVEIIRDDLCAFGFWIDACLVAFCDGNHSVDFVRHRARLVTREVSQLLPHLDDPPSAPARLAPIPK